MTSYVVGTPCFILPTASPTLAIKDPWCLCCTSTSLRHSCGYGVLLLLLTLFGLSPIGRQRGSAACGHPCPVPSDRTHLYICLALPSKTTRSDLTRQQTNTSHLFSAYLHSHTQTQTQVHHNGSRPYLPSSPDGGCCRRPCCQLWRLCPRLRRRLLQHGRRRELDLRGRRHHLHLRRHLLPEAPQPGLPRGCL